MGVGAHISQMPLGFSPPVVHWFRSVAWRHLSPGAATDGGHARALSSPIVNFVVEIGEVIWSTRQRTKMKEKVNVV